ncbi:S-layer homology domain-containing protein [Paenibacillus pinistramenti]|uniref:S-layer homology domain-containing protein n=1 Tax=Paenibacillus pinistramenti TaxID=1768003 RepID=UPI0011097B47|nr:S-layer homology domain-containing protein [Paenibacillus pinistramenti]
MIQQSAGQKLAAGLAALCLTAALGSQVLAADGAFTDLNSVNGQDKILSLQEQGVLKGTGNDEFHPAAALTAAEAVQMLANGLAVIPAAEAAGSAAEENGGFLNVTDSAWYAEAFLKASSKGLEIDSTIDPSQAVTREQYTAYLVQLIEKWAALPMIKLVPAEITDAADITPDYQGAIQRALTWNIAALDDKGSFNPKGNITRAEAAVMLYNAIEFVNGHPYQAPAGV